MDSPDSMTWVAENGEVYRESADGELTRITGTEAEKAKRVQAEHPELFKHQRAITVDPPSSAVFRKTKSILSHILLSPFCLLIAVFFGLLMLFAATLEAIDKAFSPRSKS